jgi:hypothetical protein
MCGYPKITYATQITYSTGAVGTAPCDSYKNFVISNESTYNSKKEAELEEKQQKINEQRLELEKCRRLNKKMKY